MKQIPYFTDAKGNVVIFRKIANVPGFTHRVIINNIACDWLANGYKPNAKHATYFMNKHETRIGMHS